ncbi:DUF6578 domain-containing protein [Leifsonia aquatica]|uniref:DUF6578 domain-containing protein n=1 Tax=Leifsonia aquatica TaxID=144185 RepID=UPI0028A822A0|nr:DUF6578 domain-containing protein [Leifsonia aquatica]
METVAVDVLIGSAEYECCGVPFAVGDEIGFALRALPGGGDGDRPVFLDDRHPMDADDPPVDVRGQVEAIVAVHQRVVPVAGAHYLTTDPGDTVERPVESVPVDDGPDGYSGADYRVLFRIPAETPLPEPRAAAQAEGEQDAEAPTELLPLLTGIVEEVAERFEDRVGILRARQDASVTLAPVVPEACAVRWNAYADSFSVELERAVWPLPPDESGIAALRSLVEAAATGGFSEILDAGRFVSVARAPDGEVRTTAAEAPRPSPGGGMVMLGSTGARMQRARSGVPYPAWG